MGNEEYTFDTKTLENVRLRLKEFKADSPDLPDLIWQCDNNKHSVGQDEAPVPALIYFLLTKCLGFPLGYRGDKTRWAIPFTFSGVRCSMAMQKFGLRLYIEKDKKTNPLEIMGKLHRAIKVLERDMLEPFGKAQMTSGNVTVVNRFHRLDNMYGYFRGTAEQSFAISPDTQGSLGKRLSMRFEILSKGNYNTVAMVNAYFSRLEHILVFCLAFSDYSSRKDDLVDFIGSNWSDKYKRVINISNGSEGKELYDFLCEVKEEFRNPSAHGGFEKNGGSLYFHIPGVAAVPAKLTGSRDRPHLDFLMNHEATCIELCQLFDRFDKWIEEKEQPYATLYLKSGLDIAFDAGFIAELRSAAKDVEEFNGWIEARSHWQDIVDNVDY
ncbi:hypothetical protein ACFLS1_06270 [Verrucomicrobiota bacterium]